MTDLEGSQYSAGKRSREDFENGSVSLQATMNGAAGHAQGLITYDLLQLIANP